MGIGDWGLGLGVWGFGAKHPTHPPQTQKPNPQGNKK